MCWNSPTQNRACQQPIPFLTTYTYTIFFFPYLHAFLPLGGRSETDQSQNCICKQFIGGGQEDPAEMRSMGISTTRFVYLYFSAHLSSHWYRYIRNDIGTHTAISCIIASHVYAIDKHFTRTTPLIFILNCSENYVASGRSAYIECRHHVHQWQQRWGKLRIVVIQPISIYFMPRHSTHRQQFVSRPA